MDAPEGIAVEVTSLIYLLIRPETPPPKRYQVPPVLAVPMTNRFSAAWPTPNRITSKNNVMKIKDRFIVLLLSDLNIFPSTPS
jgi:hypothetical protein